MSGLYIYLYIIYIYASYNSMPGHLQLLREQKKNNEKKRHEGGGRPRKRKPLLLSSPTSKQPLRKLQKASMWTQHWKTFSWATYKRKLSYELSGQLGWSLSEMAVQPAVLVFGVLLLPWTSGLPRTDPAKGQGRNKTLDQTMQVRQSR